jgi:hypothetical protein
MADAPFRISVQRLPREDGGCSIKATVTFLDDHPDGMILRQASLALQAAIEAEAARGRQLQAGRD